MKQDSLGTIITHWKILKKGVHSSLLLGDQTLENYWSQFQKAYLKKTYSCQQQQQKSWDAFLIYKMTVSRCLSKMFKGLYTDSRIQVPPLVHINTSFSPYPAVKSPKPVSWNFNYSTCFSHLQNQPNSSPRAFHFLIAPRHQAASHMTLPSLCSFTPTVYLHFKIWRHFMSRPLKH